MCHLKKRYADEEDAFLEIEGMKIKYIDIDLRHNLRSYKCPVCLGFHLTHKISKNSNIEKYKWMSEQSLKIVA